MTRFSFLIGLLTLFPLLVQAQDDSQDTDPFDWLSDFGIVKDDEDEDDKEDDKDENSEWPFGNDYPDEEEENNENDDDGFPTLPPNVDIDEIDGDGLDDFGWKDWGQSDWEDHFKDDYKHYYIKKNANKVRNQAYDLANEQGIEMPQRYGSLTYDPQEDTIYFESDDEYADQLNEFLEGLEDEVTEIGKDLALELLYTQLEPVLKVLKKKNAALLDIILPRAPGVPVIDPAEKAVKEKQEGKQNFKYWVKLAAENIMQNIFKKNAEGKYELQRDKIELLKQVGIVRFLKMSAMDWEMMQSFTLEVPDEVLDYAHSIQDIYQSGKTTFQAGKDLYRELTTFDTELLIPDKLDQLKDLTHKIATNQLTMTEMAGRRKKVLALTYRQLAKRYQQYADDLHDKLNEENQLKMSEAERIKASQIAQEYLSESMRLAAKAEELLSSSYQASNTVEKDKYVQQYAVFKKLENMYLE